MKKILHKDRCGNVRLIIYDRDDDQSVFQYEFYRDDLCPSFGAEDIRDATYLIEKAERVVNRIAIERWRKGK